MQGTLLGSSQQRSSAGTPIISILKMIKPRPHGLMRFAQGHTQLVSRQGWDLNPGQFGSKASCPL